MARCFVMQPFDGGMFDKRYDDVLAPAIASAGLEPYRVDRDPSVSIPIDDIERGIRDSEVCLADITVDNPNVWFELGYAIACDRDVVLICSSDRASHFPFDIQHRNIIRYSTEAPRDFQDLALRITDRLHSVLRKRRQMVRLADSPVVETAGLESHEIVALVTIMQSVLDPENPPSAYSIKQDMARAGYTNIAAVLGVQRLVKLRFVDSVQASDYNREGYVGYVATDLGTDWLMKNQDKLVLRRTSPESSEELPF